MRDLERIAVAGTSADLARLEFEQDELDHRNELGATPLLVAIANKNAGVALALVERGADCRIRDREGRTALHWAVEHGLLETAEAIVGRWPETLELEDAHGNQPLWAAVIRARAGDSSMARLLAQRGGNLKHENKHGLRPVDIPDRTGDAALAALVRELVASQCAAESR